MAANQRPQLDASGMPIPAVKKPSAIYDVQMKEINKSVEDYILNNAWSIVANNPDIMAVGAFFEPYAFDPAIKDYTIYVTTADAANLTAQSYGDYATYGSTDYYAKAAQSQKPVFTNPYVDQGVTMVTAFPVVWQGKTQGVIIVDICTDDATLVFDSISSQESICQGGILRFNTVLKGRGVSTPLGCKTALCRAGVKDAVRQGEAGSLTLAPHSATHRKNSRSPSESARLPQAVPPPTCGW